jgi:hypothetical protein
LIYDFKPGLGRSDLLDIPFAITDQGISMPFTIKQISPLRLLAKDDEKQGTTKVQTIELKEIGSPKLVSKPKFKEDREEWLVVFQGKLKQGAVEVDVTYSLGMDGHQVESVEIVIVPMDCTVHSEPEFETRDCEDDD